MATTTYLLTWNPNNWHWDTLNKEIVQVAAGSHPGGRWSAGNTKRIQPGDRLFWLRQGREPRGIFASGYSTSEVSEDDHWSDDRTGDMALYVDVEFDTLFDPDKERVISIEELKSSVSSSMNWQPFASGTTIPTVAAARLEKAWAKHLDEIGHDRKGKRPTSRTFPDELPVIDSFVEGAKRQVTVNAYERSDAAREACIKHWGTQCSVCGLVFQDMYGEMGEGFIHVHHLRPMAATRKSYMVDPVKDMRPVCPNCHAMLHQKSPPLSIEQLRKLLRKVRSRST